MNNALIQSFLERQARYSPKKTALVCGDQRVSYGNLDQMANRVANALRKGGVRRGDRVVICLENGVEAVAAIFGTLKAEAVFVPLSPGTRQAKLGSLLNDCSAAALFCGQTYWSGLSNPDDATNSNAASIMSAFSALKLVVECGSTKKSTAQGVLAWEDVQRTFSCEKPPCVNVDLDLASILYTSGTTGQPKGVMCDHSNMMFAVESIANYLEQTNEDIVLSVLPLSFGYGLNQVMLTFYSGGTLVLERSFAYPAMILERIAEERATAFPAVPTVFALLTQLPPQYDLSSMRYLTNAAAALPEAHIEPIRECFPNARLFSMYGLTEVTRALYLPPEELERKPGSVGIAIPGTEVWIENSEGERLPPGEVGELVIRGRHVARGYWNCPTETQERFRAGAIPGERIFYTGDLFRADADGFFYFVARKDDVIKSRGFKVAPKEIEEVLHRIEGVEEAAVFGVPDAILGHAIEAVLVTPTAQLTRAGVLAHCRKHLEEFMVPRDVHFVNALPRTVSGKIRRMELPVCVASLEHST